MSNRFVFVAPAYNASLTIKRMLMSVALQTHEDWLILIKDDMSTDGTALLAREIAYRQGFADKIKIVENTEKRWEMRNVLEMIRDPLTKEDDIICRLDADDFLTDLTALQDISTVYDEHKCEALWTAHRWADTWKNISGPMSEGADPYKHPWVSSHMKTFRRHLIDDVKEENFMNQNGDYCQRTGDQYLYLPVLHNSKKNLYFPKVTYYYTIDMKPETFASDDAKFQQQEGLYLRSRGFIK